MHPHVTFIHGIANKPPKDALLRQWEDALKQGGLDLGAKGVTTSMVYWADVMYAEPTAEDADFESVGEALGTNDADEDMQWVESLTGAEREMVEALSKRLGFDAPSPADDQFAPDPPDISSLGDGGIQFEAVPLPWFIKRRAMKRVLRDVHHYLFDAQHTPREGETFQVKQHIRNLFIDQLKADAEANAGGPLVVVSHSMGTVVSYDCLKNDARCPAIAGYMTVGSPLGLSEVHDNLKPGYSRRNGFPNDKLSGGWVNVYDRLDPVAFDARIANDYQNDGDKVVTDERVRNGGAWRHSSWKYFGQDALCDHLKTLLRL